MAHEWRIPYSIKTKRGDQLVYVVYEDTEIFGLTTRIAQIACDALNGAFNLGVSQSLFEQYSENLRKENTHGETKQAYRN